MLITLLALVRTPVLAQPVVTNATTAIYATLGEPVLLSCASNGTLYCGRNSGDGAAAYRIYRVDRGGSFAGEFGDLPIPDPDAVIADESGIISGAPGSVLVGGVHSNPLSQGKISRITPAGAVTTLFGPTTDFHNPTAFAFDGPGRLLFTDYNLGRVMVTTGAAPVPLFSLSHPQHIEIDAAGRIAVTSGDEPRLRLYTSAGVLSNANFASVKTASPVARGPGGKWGTDLYVISTAGNLIRVDLAGNTTVAGSGFAAITHFTFGSDGAFYASELATDRIYRFAAPAAPGCATTVYASVADPIKLCFAPDGMLFVGRDNAGSGGNNSDAVKIHRIAPGGAPVAEYGNLAITDPDAVFFDTMGNISGAAGSVIVGGVTASGGAQGKLSRILPDGGVTTLFGPSSTMINPSDFVSDSSGRLLFTDFEGGKIWMMTNGTPTVLVSDLTQPLAVAVDVLDRILVNAAAESCVRLYSSGGALLTNCFVPAVMRTPLALGPGGFWGTGVYCVNTNGDLITVDLAGNTTRVGVGFAGLDDFAFGPDGALYASHFDNDSIWRIAPSLRLSVAFTTTNTVAVSWPSPSTGWTLQQNTNSISSVNWSNVTNGVQDDGTTRTLIVNPPTGNRFYRLKNL